MTAENEIDEYMCPDCQKDNISFEKIEFGEMLRFFCRICKKKFKVETGVLIYLVGLINFLKKKYP